jgi:4-hydroxyphenylacetate 3-monooxygenase
VGQARRATDTVLDDIGGIVTRVGDETVGEMWSLFDGQDVLNEVDPQFSANIRRHIDEAVLRSCDPFHVSANTDPKGDRSKPPQEQDPDMLLHVVKETDAGIVVRGAKYETAAAYANQAFTKPTIANWGNAACPTTRWASSATGLARPEVHLPHRLRRAAPPEDYPLANRFDEVDALVIFDNVLIPGRTCCSTGTPRRRVHPRHPAPLLGLRLRAAQLKLADMMIGARCSTCGRPGLDKQQAVQEKLAQLASTARASTPI